MQNPTNCLAVHIQNVDIFFTRMSNGLTDAGKAFLFYLRIWGMPLGERGMGSSVNSQEEGKPGHPAASLFFFLDFSLVFFLPIMKSQAMPQHEYYCLKQNSEHLKKATSKCMHSQEPGREK